MADTYIALLRGVNVSQNTLKMERVRDLWAALGFKNVRTYVQSGNIVFQAENPLSTWCSTVEQGLAGETRLPVAVFVRTLEELKGIIACNPFLKDQKIDPSKLHLTLLARDAGHDAFEKLSGVKTGGDQFQLSGKEVYVYCPNGYGRTKLSNNALEKLLSVKATTRNWRTVTTLVEIASR
jgi:uncharacterized protein (DUF1697 family)